MGFKRLSRGSAFLAVLCVGLSACGSASEQTRIFDLIPLVYAEPVDPKETFAELVNDADLVVVGSFQDASIEFGGTEYPAPDDAPDLAFTEFVLRYTVAPNDGGENIEIVSSVSRRVESARDFLAEFSKAKLPEGDFVFALTDYADWGYDCVTPEAMYCPLGVEDGKWISPYGSDVKPYADDPIQPTTSLNDAVEQAKATASAN